jgi:alpha-N-arabinofuranosidase
MNACTTPASLWLVLAILAPSCLQVIGAVAPQSTVPDEPQELIPRHIHVAKSGSQFGNGEKASPYRTIGEAAQIAQPGDTIIVHQGTYRERVTPARGGTSENRRIVYRVARGERVVVKGSERITSWEHQGGGLWEVELVNDFFGDYNPYELKLSGGWLNYGQWHHRGDVYLNGEAYFEKQTIQEVRRTAQSWFAQVDERRTRILANFGDADPNQELAEINVRESLFMPETSGLEYITVDGFHFQHSAENWAPPTIELQMGAVGTRMGKHWIIENCTIVNARCVGIILGHAPGVDYSDIDAYGDHVVRNNTIRRCGQAGIAGQKGATRSLISHNLIEDTNYRKEFGGWETAAIKFHNTVDTVIDGNLIRGVFHQKQGAFGIWIDYGNQGTRISRNIVYDTQAATVFLEMNHGPALVDNNVLIGHEIRSNSEATVFAHNLLVDCPFAFRPDLERRSQYYSPHTTRVVGRKAGTAQDDKWFNNIFVRTGLEEVQQSPGHESDFNLFLEGAGSSSFGDRHSRVDAFTSNPSVESQPLGVRISFLVNETPLRMRLPMVGAALVGVFSTVDQTLEDRHGQTISVDTDFNGARFSPPLPGPLADLQPGLNTIQWSQGEPEADASPGRRR